jgi:nucleoid-associated protein YgaU
MPSQATLIGAGAAATALVVAGVGAVVWTYPDLVWRSPPPVVVVSVPEPPATAMAQRLPAPATPPASAPAPADLARPSFDAVNVDPTGQAVIAGRAAPDARVELRDGGKTLAKTTADASGQFVLLPPPLAPGAHNLSLSAEVAGAAPEISDTIPVTVVGQEVKTASAAPEAPPPSAPQPAPETRTLSTSPPGDPSRVVIRSVEAGADGALVAKGSAEPNTLVRLYLNGADLADARTETDGLWSLTIRRGLSAGAYVVRAEEVGQQGAKVVATAETRFDFPAVLAAPDTGPAPAPLAPAADARQPAPPPANAVVDSVQTTQVITGRTLWEMSQSYYGDPTRYPLIYEANKGEIHNPNLIFPGQVFVVPKTDKKP